MKTLLTIIIGALVLAGLSVPALAQVEPQKQEAKIVEVQEITALLVKDSTGAIVKRIPVSGRTEYNMLRREERIRNPLKAGETMRSEILDPRIEFRDENGMMVKSISTKDIVTTRTEKLNLVGTEKNYTIERVGKLRPIINKNGKYLLLTQYSRDDSYTDPEGKVIISDGLIYRDITSPIQLTFYDVRGNLLFEKHLLKGDILASLSYQYISDNGEVIVIFTSWPEGINDPKIIIMNKSGMEIIRITEGIPDYLSPNGKYLAIDHEVTRFYNTVTKQYWDSSTRYFIISITTDGLATVRDSETMQTTVIYLKDYIKE